MVLVALVDQEVVLALLDLLGLVGRVEALLALDADRVRDADGLAAAGDAAAGARHDFDEVVVGLAGADVVDEALGVGEAVDDRHADLPAGRGHGGFLDGLHAADFLEVDGGERLVVELFDRVAEGGFHDAAGRAEDHAAAGGESHGHVERFGLELIELDAERVDHALDFAGGHDDVDFLLAVDVELRQLGFELLRRAGHDGDDHEVLALAAELFGQDLLGDGAEHGLRGTAAGEVRDHFGEVDLGELDPGGAAAGEHRERAAVGDAVDELGGFLEDGHVGGEAGVVDVLEAHELQGGDELARHVLARLRAEVFAQRHADGRSDLDHDGLGGIVQGVPHAVAVLLRHDRAGGADGGALAAVHAFDRAEGRAEGRGHAGVGAAVGEVDRADALDFGADAHAVAAEHALVRVADERRGGEVDRVVLLHGFEADVLDAELVGDALQGAVLVAGAGRAFAVVVGEQEFHADLAHVADLLGVRVDDHAGRGGGGAGRHDALAFDEDEAETACAVDAQFGVVAEGRDLDPGFADDFEEVALVGERDFPSVDGQCFNGIGHDE